MNIEQLLSQGLSVYCEAGIGRLATQPLNTLSNSAIFISAYFSYKLVISSRTRNRVIRLVLLVLILIGLGSTLWHGAPHYLTNWADTLPIAILLVFVFYYLLGKLFSEKKYVWSVLLIFLAAEAPFIFGIFPSLNGFIPYAVAFLFAFSILFSVLKKYKLSLKLPIAIITLFLTAFFFRTVDLPLCRVFPAGTHFLWHILNSFMFYLVVKLMIVLEKAR